MARVPALNVRWFDGRLVGKVVSPGPTYFAYDAGWLADGHNLSPLSVPFTPALHRQRVDGFDQLPGFLADCLPDQWGRRLMMREFRERELTATPMRMLAWVGRRAIGALYFEPALEERVSAGTWQEVSPLMLTREAQAVLQEDASAAFRHLAAGGTAGGALPKATIALLANGKVLTGGDVSSQVRERGRLGLLKLDHEDDPTRATTDGRLESAYLRMARAAGIRTARFEVRLERDRGRARHHLFVQRFDLVSHGRRRLHQVTLAGALHRFDLTYDDLLQATRSLTQDHAHVVEAVRRMCFNVRSGNADDHGKNHSFLYDDTSRRWSLSPAYDLTLSYSREAEFRGLFPNSFGRTPRRQALQDAAAEAGVSPAEFDALDARVAEAIAHWPAHAKASRLPASLRDRAAAVHEELARALEFSAPARRGTRRKLW